MAAIAAILPALGALGTTSAGGATVAGAATAAGTVAAQASVLQSIASTIAPVLTTVGAVSSLYDTITSTRAASKIQQDIFNIERSNLAYQQRLQMGQSLSAIGATGASIFSPSIQDFLQAQQQTSSMNKQKLVYGQRVRASQLEYQKRKIFRNFLQLGSPLFDENFDLTSKKKNAFSLLSSFGEE